MPNHITTRIKITGDPEAVKRVLNKIKNDEFGMGTIDFEKIIRVLSISLDTFYSNKNYAARKI